MCPSTHRSPRTSDVRSRIAKATMPTSSCTFTELCFISHTQVAKNTSDVRSHLAKATMMSCAFNQLCFISLTQVAKNTSDVRSHLAKATMPSPSPLSSRALAQHTQMQDSLLDARV